MARRALLHLVCYDVRCPRRLGRVHRYLKKRAIPVQYSVFMVELNERQRSALLKGLRALIHPQQDDVRVYPLPEKPEWFTIGESMWPVGMHVCGVALPTSVL